LSVVNSNEPVREFLELKLGAVWAHFKTESFAFWMICSYLFFEYVRPHSIIKGLDILPWTQITIVLAGLFWIVESSRGKRITTGANFLMVLFFVVILLSSVTAYKSSVAYEMLANFYTWLIIFFLIQVVVTSEKRFLIFLFIFMVASFKLSWFGATTWAMRGFSFTSWGIRGPPGFFTNSGELAAQMCVFFGISYYFYEAVKHFLSGWMLRAVALMPITAAMTIMAASSRGAQVALAVQAYFIFLHGKVSLRSIVSIVVVSGLLYFMLPAEQLERFQSAGDDTTSIQRLLYWGHGWDMMLEYPFLGVGYFNFPTYYNDHFSYDLFYESAQLPHNIFVQVGADLGLSGLLVYFLLVWQGFKIPATVRKRLAHHGKPDDWRIPISKGLGVGFLGFLIAGQFVSIVYYPYMWVHLALCCALLNTTASLSLEIRR